MVLFFCEIGPRRTQWQTVENKACSPHITLCHITNGLSQGGFSDGGQWLMSLALATAYYWFCIMCKSRLKYSLGSLARLSVLCRRVIY